MPDSVLIATSAGPDRGSGISTYSREISMEMRRRGITVYYASPKPEDNSWLTNWDITHIATEQTDDQTNTALELLNFIKEKKIEAVFNNDNPILQSIAPFLTCPVIVVGHLNSHAIGRVACYNHRWVDYLVAISHDMQRSFVSKYAVPLYKCPVIHNGLHHPEQKEISDYNGSRKLRVLFAGEYSKRKGGDLVATAIRSQHPAWEHLRLDWYGNVPKRFQRQLKKRQEVAFHGRVGREAFGSALAQADILLLASRSEGCPMAMLEAMSLGVIPIASDGVGAMRWLVTSGYDGYICNLNNWPSQALDCLLHLATNPELMDKMKSRVAKRFLAEFTIDKIVDQLLDLAKLPTVDRSTPPQGTRILKWHRNSPDLDPPTILERICFRLGVLRFEGWLNIDHGK